MEEKKKKEEEEKLRISKLEAAQHEREVEHIERFYTELSHKERNTTSSLLLDSVVTPMVEPSCRRLKHKLEEKVEVVRNFWRNKVEGGSRMMHSHYYSMYTLCILTIYCC